ncbi:cytosine deaminase [Pseudomonas putida]|uniref:Cytosine deaminase n=1 Tax=Pseudomonas putida TaxID=303 RepID=A0A2Z4RW41_PSEPU|nr:amidohydrolase family protein [Pseudomonas putida]AWY44528.1 cytosine deaminase [Pseudomonas putida]
MFWLRNVRPYGGENVDLQIVDGRIGERRPASGSPVVGLDLDGQGQILVPSLVESHIHLDKTLWGQPWRPHSAGPNLKARIANERQILRELKSPIAERAGALLEQCIARGSLLLRCHVDADPELGIEHVQAMLELRQHYADLVDIEFVTFPQVGLVNRPGVEDLMREALALGVEVVGGLDPCGIDNDPIAHLTTLFELASQFDRGIDIHLHDGGELGLWQIARIVDFTERYQRQGRVMISHAFCLGMKDWSQVQPLAERLAANRISLMTTAPSDIAYPPFNELRSAGVNVCLGSDGIRDAWTPMGNGDMLERAMLLALRCGMRTDPEICAAFDAASTNGARALGRSDHGLATGQTANLLLLPTETLSEAVVSRPLARTVISRGNVVAKNGSLLHSRL